MKSDEIIVIEDNDTMRLGIVESLQREGYKVSAFDNGIDALKKFKINPYAAAVIDLRMEPINGIEILRQIKECNPKTEVLMISAYGTVEDAVKAMQLGAADFLTKPFSPDELRIRIKKIWEKLQKEKRIEDLIEQNRLLNEELLTDYKDIIGNSRAIKNVFSLIEQVAGKDSTVLILGESGTGKELVARAIHRKSKRADKPFIKVNCGILNENLLESELFGHERGAFTGAVRQKKGRFELADTGTLFLDEIGDISPAMQIKLLRVLQEGEFERVGGEITVHTDVRIISATNKDLQKLVAEGKFREDLFYRLSVIPISLPSLRERKEDIIQLVDYFLQRLAEKNRQQVKTISKEGMKLLIDYPWPGNIRELENLIERLFVISVEDGIAPDLIARHLASGIASYNGFENLPLEEAVFAFEKNLIVQAMKKSNGIKNRAAKLLGISTSVLYYKLEKFGLL
ncbi:MAG TPA: sigma-54 dependent transcriptional regulator [Ignavibacteriaceae bacterium]|nr:sigma-54 dependent transcriptional regulator [Ignavibacteriaceae bacterium]